MEWRDVFALAARSLIALLFLASAFAKITDFASAAGSLASAGVVWAPFFCAAAALIESAGGLSLITGYKARWSAALLAAYLVPATWIGHAAGGRFPDALKNLAVMGGLLQLAAFGPGALSLDGVPEN